MLKQFIKQQFYSQFNVTNITINHSERFIGSQSFMITWYQEHFKIVSNTL